MYITSNGWTWERLPDGGVRVEIVVGDPGAGLLLRGTLSEAEWTDLEGSMSAASAIPGTADTAKKLHRGEVLKTREEYDAEKADELAAVERVR